MSIMEFKKKSKRFGIQAGYYFKGEFLSRYKTEAIEILRNRIEKAGKETGDMSRDVWDKGKEVLPDVWEAIHHEWKLGKIKTDKSNIKIQEWRERERIKKIPYQIEIIKQEIKMEQMKMREKMNDIKEFYEGRIKIQEEKIKQLEIKNENKDKEEEKPLLDKIGN